jgi:TRAP-type C4-dicarboxylate transport system permease small subunit
MLRFILKLVLVILVLLVGLVLTGFGVHAILKLVVADTLGLDIVKSSSFYFAVVVLTLIVYLFLIVFAIRTWEGVKQSLLDSAQRYTARGQTRQHRDDRRD